MTNLIQNKRKPNVLVLSHLNGGNVIFQEYCQGILKNSGSYHYIDYIEEYIQSGKNGFEKKIIEKIDRYSIEIIFLIWWSCDLTIDPCFLAELSSKKIKIVMNYFDTEYFFEGVDRYYAQFADLIVLPDYYAKFRYMHLNINVHTSFAMYSNEHYYKIENKVKDIDVSFIGNLKQGDRKIYIDYLKAKGIKVDTYGIDSDHGFVSLPQMIDIFNRSKINLNFTSIFPPDNYCIEISSINQRIKQSKGRPIEIALSGGFILSQYAVGIEEMFEPDKEIVLFRSKEELLEKIVFYLKAEEKREAIASESYAKAQKKYEVVNGFSTIFKLVEESKRNSEIPVFLDRIFFKNFSSFRFFYIANFLMRAKIKHLMEEFLLLLKNKKFNMRVSYFFFIRGFLHYIRKKPKFEKMLKKIRFVIPLKIKY